MNDASQVTEFGKVLIYLMSGIVFVSITLFLGRLVALRRPSPVKNSTYECGESPRGNSWVQFNSRFYVIALIFLIFDVEMVFIFPWATVFGQKALIQADPRWGWLSLGEMFVFVGILLLGLVYVWRKGDLDWIKPEYIKPEVDSNIPLAAYAAINNETYQVRKFTVIEPDVLPPPPPEGEIKANPVQPPRLRFTTRNSQPPTADVQPPSPPLATDQSLATDNRQLATDPPLTTDYRQLATDPAQPDAIAGDPKIDVLPLPPPEGEIKADQVQPPSPPLTTDNRQLATDQSLTTDNRQLATDQSLATDNPQLATDPPPTHRPPPNLRFKPKGPTK